MSVIKSYTDIEQSKKLAEILPIESADMHCFVANSLEKQEINYAIRYGTPIVKTDIPCWSLVALLNVINDDYYTTLYHDGVAWNVEAIHHDNVKDKHDAYANTQVDACYDLILKIKNSSI